MQVIKGNIVNVFEDSIQAGELILQDGRIFTVKLFGDEDPDLPYLIPGFIDAHVHIESSMLTPAQFGRLAVVHGTVATVSDPHEIANVLGVEGVEYMIEDGNQIPFKFYFGAPSCVPATDFESAGAVIDSGQIEKLLEKEEIVYLAEMMNFPGVIYENEEVLAKIAAAHRKSKPIDGHAPGLMGEEAKKYFSKGISTDHECFTLEEAEGKLKLGVKILIREGSAAKNFEALIPLAVENAHQMMFCSDDKHPDDLVEGHINRLVLRAIDAGVDIFDALRMASLNPVLHYGLSVGLLREGDMADFLIVKNLKELEIQATFIDGEKVAENGNSLISKVESRIVNNFNCRPVNTSQISFISQEGKDDIRVIKVEDRQLITGSFITRAVMNGKELEADLENDVLKLVVYNRYQLAEPAIAFIQGFGLKEGAIASSVAHDSHNIIAVGVDDASITEAINLIIREKGGVSAVSNEKMGVLPLPVAGLMSNKDAEVVAEDYKQIDAFCKEILGSKLKSPFMSLSFMALLVIPSLKLSDKGLFDGEKFEFTDLMLESE